MNKEQTDFLEEILYKMGELKKEIQEIKLMVQDVFDEVQNKNDE